MGLHKGRIVLNQADRNTLFKFIYDVQKVKLAIKALKLVLQQFWIVNLTCICQDYGERIRIAGEMGTNNP